MTVLQLILFYTAILVIGIAGAAGDILIYRWAKSTEILWLVAGLACWIVCLLVFGATLRHFGRSLSVTFALAAVLHVVIVLGYDCFANRIFPSTLEWAGLSLALIGMILIEVAQSRAIEL